ncbi:uncharacterized protein ACLA_014520 [Aspergillus clavatus NRRL 1]|uniref:Argonaute complex, subunit Arb1 n=1 Tax=Aspergillus clavatus (strain ATCC 1007 / CBS 513.65 / DSM 816 / NCTC 3887 / NRRL 1 / QM 1276 / 107) TaxID=344612 RepID=A1CB97_ASPCL|nr:uncharacterized protein ACLA_014520 [Aspergillus clavatus NRRL 1]EAW13015.1 conserved hypothetical protein [Aspergillus clavatus NRRL 1]
MDALSSGSCQELPVRTTQDIHPDLEPDMASSESAGQDNKPTESHAEQSEAEDNHAEPECVTIDWAEAKKKKKKKKKKRSNRPKSKRGKNKPTGFEEYYVDAPITPEEYANEQEIYDVRMEDAILRYQKNRRIESERREVFLKYLQYGGVDIGPKMFSGLDQRELNGLDSEQILLARGQTSIAQERSDLTIDFNAVVKGYLTSYFPFYFNPENDDMVKLATVTIRNFLSYLLYHDVVPEYKDNIDAARTSCDIATQELWKNQQFTSKGPGDFNTACSTLFGGVFYDHYVEDDQWSNSKDDTVRMTNEVARKVVKFALAGAGTDRQAFKFQELANGNALRAMRVEDIDGFEVTDIIFPDAETKEFYQVHAGDLHPIGRLLGKVYRDPGKPEIDLSPDERGEWVQGPAPAGEFEFFLEENLLRLCYPGMKVLTSVWELNCGVHYFDEILNTYCSIYTVLCNDLMIGWKEPKTLHEIGGEEEDETDEDEGQPSKEEIGNGKPVEEVL